MMDGENKDMKATDEAAKGAADEATKEAEKSAEEKEMTPEQTAIAELTAKLELLEKKAQSDADRLRTEKKKLEEERDALVKEKMTEKERADFEAKKRADELAARERELNEKTLALVKRDVMDEIGLPVKLKDNVNGGDEDAIRKSATVLKEYINDLVAEQVSQKFKGAGEEQKDKERKIPTGNGNGKTMKREQFDLLDPFTKAEVIKTTEIID